MPSTNGSAPKTAILYSRVSTDEQARSGYSLAQQLEALRDYAESEGYEVLEEVQDPGQSGASLERPGMDWVRDLVQGGGVSVVLAQDRDRFSREPAYTYLLKREFEERGTLLRSLNDRGDESPEGQLTDGILDQLAKFERAKTAERTRRGKLRKAREGKLVAASRPLYGFKWNESRDGYEINEATMPVVKRIFRMLAVEGSSVNNIKRTLEGEGVPTPSAALYWNRSSGRYWSHKTLKDIFTQDAYRVRAFDEIRELVGPDVAARLDPHKSYGISWWGKKRVISRQVAYTKPDGTRGYRSKQQLIKKPKEEWIAVPIPASGIPGEWVDAARDIVENRRSPSRAGLRFWELSGSLLVCGCCGRVMIADRRRKDRDGEYYFYYRCNRKKYHGASACEMPMSWPAEKTERVVWSRISSLLSDPVRLRAGLERMIEEERRSSRGDPEQDIRRCLEEIESVNDKRRRAQDLGVDGLLSADELRERLEELDRRKNVLQREIGTLRDDAERLEDLQHDADSLLQHYSQQAPESLQSLTPEERHKVYQMLRLKVTASADGTLEAAGMLSSDTSELCREKSLSGSG